mgnify:CR=1 FL=1
MTLKVPEANTATFRKVMDALGGEDYAYYSFDVKNIEDAESRKKVQILLKVYVSQAERIVLERGDIGGIYHISHDREVSIRRQIHADTMRRHLRLDQEPNLDSRRHVSGSSRVLTRSPASV